MKQSLTVRTNQVFIDGFIKRAQENGFSKYEAEELLKEASVMDWLNDFYTNRRDDVREWWNNDWDWTQKARAGYRSTLGTGFNPLNWGDYDKHLGDIQENEHQRMAPLFQERAIHKLQQNDPRAMMEAQNKFTYALSNSRDLGFKRNQGNDFLNAVKPYQEKLNKDFQYKHDLDTSNQNIKTVFGRPLLEQPTAKPTPTGVGFELPVKPIKPGINYDVSATRVKNLL